MSFLKWIGSNHPKHALMLTSPHSGERIPAEASWMKVPDSKTLATDVDRYVDELYRPVCEKLSIPMLATEIHRYIIDLNRWPEDIDASAVEGATAKIENFVGGFHWSKTSGGAILIEKPIARELHDRLTKLYYEPFHLEVAKKQAEFASKYPKGATIYHFDCHSMPSKGTGLHRDSGEKRADVVISDLKGKSAGAAFKDLTIEAFKREGFNVSYNWPYYGGRITERYGHPEQRRETIQIELNRSLYLDESTRNKKASFEELRTRLQSVFSRILTSL